MNTLEQISVTEQQENDRVVKGYRLYNEGKVTQIEQNIFEVIGDKGDLYAVEDFSDDINPVYTCGCEDYYYRHIQCKHITAVQFYQLNL